MFLNLNFNSRTKLLKVPLPEKVDDKRKRLTDMLRKNDRLGIVVERELSSRGINYNKMGNKKLLVSLVSYHQYFHSQRLKRFHNLSKKKKKENVTKCKSTHKLTNTRHELPESKDCKASVSIQKKKTLPSPLCFPYT